MEEKTMKSYFQKLYNKTGKKPFTFLNCALCLLIPIIVLIVVGSQASASEGAKVMAVFIPVTVGCIVGNIVLQFVRFKSIGKAIWLTVLNFLASTAFFCKLILFPFIGFFFKMSGAMTDVQMGNFSAANNNMNNARSGKARLSAFNWFQYDGRTFEDVQVGEERPEDYSTDNLAWSHSLNRSFTAEEDLKAKNLGFQNAKDAENQGRISDVVK